MKHLSLFKHLACACGMAVSASLVSSCNTASPQAKANQLAASPSPTVYSYNDSASARTRIYTQAGPLPENTARAIETWLENSEVKNFSYAYPQYFLSVPCPKTGKAQVWGICSDGQGNLVGILIPRSGVAAWDLPFVGAYKMYVCDGRMTAPGRSAKLRDVLSETIMEELSNRGYDTFRLDSRKAQGLVDEQYLISKPLSAEEKARMEKLKKEEAEAAEAAAKAAKDKPADNAETATPVADAAAPGPAKPDPVASEDEDSSDDSSSTDDDSSSDDSSSSDADL